MYACRTGPEREATLGALWCSEKKPTFTKGEEISAPVRVCVSVASATSSISIQPFPVCHNSTLLSKPGTCGDSLSRRMCHELGLTTRGQSSQFKQVPFVCKGNLQVGCSDRRRAARRGLKAHKRDPTSRDGPELDRAAQR